MTEEITRFDTREFSDQKIDDTMTIWVESVINMSNGINAMHSQMIKDKDTTFGGGKSSKAGFVNVRNYISLVGKKEKDLEIRAGYQGDTIMQMLPIYGLGCAYAGKEWSKLRSGHNNAGKEKAITAIALGYAAEGAEPRKFGMKTYEQVASIDIAGAEVTDELTNWFKYFVDLALQAPTVNDEQNFKVVWKGYATSGAVLLEVTAGDGDFAQFNLGVFMHRLEWAFGTAAMKVEWANLERFTDTIGRAACRRFRY